MTAPDRFLLARIAHLATVTFRGHPHVVPCCFVVDGETIYSAVDQKPKSTLALRRIDNLRANPNATMLVDHYDDNWTQLWWVRADGTARVLDGGDEHAHAIALLTVKYAQYVDAPPPGAVIAIDVTRWSAWP